MMLRAVHDTNVVLAARRSSHPTSPNREILERWLRGEYALLYSEDILAEYAEKLAERRKESERLRCATIIQSATRLKMETDIGLRRTVPPLSAP